MATLTIRKIIEDISSGVIRIPSFQRDFVWSPNDITFLMDSIYKDIPIGSIYLWKTSEKLKTEN